MGQKNQEFVGSISHNQGHEMVLQIERGIKNLKLVPRDAIAKLLNANFFETVITNYPELALKPLKTDKKIIAEKRIDYALNKYIESNFYLASHNEEFEKNPVGQIKNDTRIRNLMAEIIRLSTFSSLVDSALSNFHKELKACCAHAQKNCEHPHMINHLINDYHFCFIDSYVSYRTCPDCGYVTHIPAENVYLPSAHICGMCWGPVTIHYRDLSDGQKINVYKCNDQKCGHEQKSHF